MPVLHVPLSASETRIGKHGTFVALGRQSMAECPDGTHRRELMDSMQISSSKVFDEKWAFLRWKAFPFRRQSPISIFRRSLFSLNFCSTSGQENIKKHEKNHLKECEMLIQRGRQNDTWRVEERRKAEFSIVHSSADDDDARNSSSCAWKLSV